MTDVLFNPDHFITILVGLLKSGKTHQALKQGAQSGLPVVVVVPSSKTKNDDLRAIPYVMFSKLKGMKKSLADLAKERGKIRVVLDRNADGALNMVEVLAALNFPSFQVWDDFPALLVETNEKKAFGVWTTLVRHNALFITITTQRVAAEVPPLIRTIVGAIYVIGPLPLKEETSYLYTQTNLTTVESAQDFHDFLKKNPPRQPLLIRG